MTWRNRNIIEETLCWITHFVAFLFVLFFLLVTTSTTGMLFLFAGMLVFLSSTLYHSISKTQFVEKDFARSIDVASIYFLVAATASLVISGTLLYFLLVLGMVLSVLVIKEKITSRVSDILLPLFATITIVLCLATSWSWLLLIGFFAYAVGTLFYLSDHRKWHHFIWHLFVMLGYAIHVMILIFR